MDIFSEVLDALNKKGNNYEITFTKDNVARGDNFLLFYDNRGITCKFTRGWSGVWRVWFNEDNPMLLENCPDSFLESILKNIK